MDGYTKLALICIAILAIGIFIFYISVKSGQETTMRRIRRDWGQVPDREYEYEEFESITHYFLYKQNKEKDEHYIDDITWNDLDMDTIFCMLNRTYSSAGEEYLYYMLRKPCLNQETLDEREALFHFFKEHKEERVNLQCLLNEIGRTKKVSIMDYIRLLGNVKKESNVKHYILIGMYVVSIVLMPFQLVAGVTCLFLTLMVGIQGYFVRKRSIEPYIISFSYVLRLLKAGDKFAKVKIPELSKYTQAIAEAKARFHKFRTGSIFLVAGKSVGASVTDALFDYVRILFHVDLIKFNTMLSEISKHVEDVEIIIDNIGIVESAIAVASFRETLPFYTLPVLKEEKKAFVSIKDVYHPLIAEPVANSIEETKGALITGSNASGKSTFLKTVAINTILAQTINTSTASKYEACFYQIYSSMALKDNLEGKESYYIVEIKSLKRILNHQDDEIPMLCFVDEVLRGTNTVERIAASAQILKSLSKEQIMCFAATHDIELTHLLESNYSNYHFQEEIRENDILFNYQLLTDRAVSRNAIRLLGIIGYEKEIIDKAEHTATQFLETGNWSL